MPIFTSRFSQERSLVGAFLPAKPKATEDTKSRQEDPRNNSASPSDAQRSQDRLELTGTQTLVSIAQARANTQTANNRTETETAQQSPAIRVDVSSLRTSQPKFPTTASLPQTTQASNALSLSVTSQTERVRSNQNAAQSTATGRLDALIKRLEAQRTDQVQQANQKENGAAVQSASQASANAKTSAENVEATPSSPADRLDALIEELQKQKKEQEAQPLAVPPREEQKAALQSNLQSISTGLQKDATIESRRNAEQTARNTDVVAERQQQVTIRNNQTEIRSLQSSQRSLEQETQRTNQAIRQLQSENARLRTSSSSSGTTLDILAQ